MENYKKRKGNTKWSSCFWINDATGEGHEKKK